MLLFAESVEYYDKLIFCLLSSSIKAANIVWRVCVQKCRGQL